MTVMTALRDINNAVLDLQSADYNTFERPLQRLAYALSSPDLKQFTDDLRSRADFDKFLENASEGGSMMGSARLNWPASPEETLGLVIQLLERGGKEPYWFLNIAHRYYYSGRKIVGDIRKITTAVVVPFNRDFATYVGDATSATAVPIEAVSTVTYNINTMNNSPLQHNAAGSHAVQNNNFAINDLKAIVDLYRQQVDGLSLDASQRRRADAQVATIEAQLLDDPDPTIINAAGKSLRNIVEGAIGGAAGNALSLAGTWAPLINMF
ncbi:hypothetical protein QTN93_00480 [Sphingomonas aerolata]|uniref:hypothetical protein n=1 Tax=Sphingomonas aerolata TaxID=185951 RepID=UPI0035A732C1